MMPLQGVRSIMCRFAGDVTIMPSCSLYCAVPQVPWWLPYLCLIVTVLVSIPFTRYINAFLPWGSWPIPTQSTLLPSRVLFPCMPVIPLPSLFAEGCKRAARGWINLLKPSHVEGGTNICSVGLATRLLAALDMGCMTVSHIYGGICHKWMHVTLYGYWQKWGQSYVSSNRSTKASVKLQFYLFHRNTCVHCMHVTCTDISFSLAHIM